MLPAFEAVLLVVVADLAVPFAPPLPSLVVFAGVVLSVAIGATWGNNGVGIVRSSVR